MTKHTAPTEDLNAANYLRANEACRYCRISRRTLSRWQKTGRVAFSRVGQRMLLFKRADLDKMVASLTVQANA